ncbi:LacI family DNA-binding transcriptional regulator [Microbacterium timonense]|uniref:LacI family DNA-binding transcriptional regulator n=1 Tax=Microbacterium timonense TaxID=2086576 RepID=UPI000D0FB989|nr:LacI family DNA-binding transcriptional regulator [Microbacterium timonense]
MPPAARRGTAAGRPTLNDVGRLAGVSAQTVSRFLTGASYVGADAGERIQQAIDALGYRPNRLARGLQNGRSDTVGVLTSAPLNYGAAETLAGLSAGAHAADVTLITAHLDVNDSQPADAKRILERFLSMRVDGVVITARIDGLESLLQQTVRDEVPIVAVTGRPVPGTGTAGADSYAAGRLVMDHLLELGHSRIAFLAGPRDSAESQERERAYYDAMATAGGTVLPVIVGGDWTGAAGYEAGLRADFASFTAVFAADDELALGFSAAARSRGYSAPGDFSLVGIDDMPEARYFAPPLTTARMDFAALGRRAFEALHEVVRTGEGAAHVVVTPELIVRESTAAPSPHATPAA